MKPFETNKYINSFPVKVKEQLCDYYKKKDYKVIKMKAKEMGCSYATLLINIKKWDFDMNREIHPILVFNKIDNDARSFSELLGGLKPFKP